METKIQKYKRFRKQDEVRNTKGRNKSIKTILVESFRGRERDQGSLVDNKF